MSYTKASKVRLAGALIGAAALVGSGGTAMASTVSSAPDDLPKSGSVQPGAMDISPSIVKAVVVEGAFGFSQDATTSNSEVASVFRLASKMLCASMPEYGTSVSAGEIAVGGSAASSSYVGTVSDIADERGTTSYNVGCACSTNMAGGGAIANVGASGVSLESVAELVGAL